MFSSFLTSHRLGKEQCDIGQQSLFDFQRPLNKASNFRRRKNAQNSTFTFNQLFDCLNAQLRAVNSNQPIWRVRLSCASSLFGCLTLEIIYSSSPRVESQKGKVVEARGFEPLTSGLQSPRSAKLSYAPLSVLFRGWLRGRDLNPRPLGYEPNELPDCSTPRQIFRKTWWAWVESNYRPHAYQACALTN